MSKAGTSGTRGTRRTDRTVGADGIGGRIAWRFLESWRLELRPHARGTRDAKGFDDLGRGGGDPEVERLKDRLERAYSDAGAARL